MQGNKSELIERLRVPEILLTTPDTITLDVSQLIYHIVWLHGGSPSHLISSIKAGMSR